MMWNAVHWQPVHVTLEQLEACFGLALSKAAAQLGMTRQDIISSCKCAPKDAACICAACSCMTGVSWPHLNMHLRDTADLSSIQAVSNIARQTPVQAPQAAGVAPAQHVCQRGHPASGPGQ